MSKSSISRAAVCIIGIAALIGIANAALHVIYGTYRENMILFVLAVVYAVISAVCFFMNLHRYRRANKNQ